MHSRGQKERAQEAGAGEVASTRADVGGCMHLVVDKQENKTNTRHGGVWSKQWNPAFEGKRAGVVVHGAWSSTPTRSCITAAAAECGHL